MGLDQPCACYKDHRLRLIERNLLNGDMPLGERGAALYPSVHLSTYSIRAVSAPTAQADR